MPEFTYILCMITSMISAVLLCRSARQPGGRLMFWGAIFFAGMAINNLMMFVDAAVVPTVDWSLASSFTALASITILIYALIWEAT